MEVQVESDRVTKLHAKYVNPTKHRDIHINVDRVPGKSAKVEIINGERKHDLTFQVGDLKFKRETRNSSKLIQRLRKIFMPILLKQEPNMLYWEEKLQEKSFSSWKTMFLL